MKINVTCAQLMLASVFILAVSINAPVSACNLNTITKAGINLPEFMGRWYEIRYNSTDHPEEDSWSDYSETYIQDTVDNNKVQIIYSSRSPPDYQCSYIVSKRLFYYTGTGTFLLSKNKLNYTYVVVDADLSNYLHAVVVMCPYVLPNGECNTTLDVKTLSRKNEDFDSFTESKIQTYFAENLPCIKYADLRKTKHSDTPCPNYGDGDSATSLATGQEKLFILFALAVGSLLTKRGVS